MPARLRVRRRLIRFCSNSSYRTSFAIQGTCEPPHDRRPAASVSAVTRWRPSVNNLLLELALQVRSLNIEGSSAARIRADAGAYLRASGQALVCRMTN